MSDTLIRQALGHVNKFMRLAKLEIATRSQMEELRSFQAKLLDHQFQSSSAPDAMEDRLRPDHPRLLELKRRYRDIQSPLVSHSKWNEEMLDGHLDLQNFRGDNAYVYQLRDLNPIPSFLLSAYYLRDVDRLGLLNKLTEDQLFGIFAFDFIGGKLVSRDLLDSINEINFLDQHLNIGAAQKFQVLDIGSGYGRFAYRLTSAFPQAFVRCVDAVAESTFLCESYLQFRGAESQTRVVPLDELNASLHGQSFDLATNIHSFSECTLATICAWLDLLCDHGVTNLMIVPNAETHQGKQLLSLEQDQSRLDFLPELEKRNYKRIALRPKYVEPCVQEHGVSPTHYHLFQRA